MLPLVPSLKSNFAQEHPDVVCLIAIATCGAVVTELIDYEPCLRSCISDMGVPVVFGTVDSYILVVVDSELALHIQ